MYRKNLQVYKTQSLEAEMLIADPHRVIQLMMQGILERLAQAKGAIVHRNFEVKSDAISKTQALLNGLQDSLDLSQGQIAEDLYALYDYMKQQLLTASINLEPELLDEIANLMMTIKSAWDEIPMVDRQKAFLYQEQKGDRK